MKTSMNKQTFAARAAKTAAANKRAINNGTFIDPTYTPDERTFHVLAAAQRATVKWLGNTVDQYNQFLEEKRTNEFWLLPVIEGNTSTETLRWIAAVTRSAFNLRSATYDSAKAAIDNARKIQCRREDAAEVVEWLRIFGLFEPENDVSRTHVDAKTNQIVKSQPTAVLTQSNLRLLWNSLYEAELKKVTTTPVQITAETAINDSHNSKDGTDLVHSVHVKNKSVASDACVESLRAFAGVGLKLHPQFQAGLAAWFKKEAQAKKGESPDAHHARVENLRKQFGRLSAEAERIGSNPFFVSKAYDYRGRMYDASGELSFQALKGLRGMFGFAEGLPIDEFEVNVAKGRMYFESVGDKLKYSDEHCAKHGAAWDGKNPDGSPNIAAAMLFTDPSRALISLDANQQGFQMLAVAFGDKALATLTNLVGDKRYDLYGHVAKMLGLASRDHAKVWLIPYVYGAGVKALTNDYNRWAAGKSQPLVDDVVMKAYVDAFEAAFPAARLLKDNVRRIFENVACPAEEFSWVLPDGFQVSYEAWEVKNFHVNAWKDGDGVAVEQDFKIRLKSTWKRNSNKGVTGLAPNLVHSLDGWMLREVQRRCNFPIVPVHDSYSCHSANVKQLRMTIVEVMQDIARGNILDSLVAQLIPEKALAEGGFFGGSQPQAAGSMGNYPLDPEAVVNPYMFM